MTPNDLVQQLLNEHADIDSIQAAARWRQTASHLLADAASQQAQDQTQAHIDAHQHAVASALDAARQRHWAVRLFPYGPLSRARRALKTHHSAAATHAANLTAIESMLDYWPATAAERASRLAELKARRKELVLLKKEAAADIRAVRSNARVASVQAGNSFLALATDRKAVAQQRRNIASERERKVAPHEGRKNAIERELIDLDRLIAKIESF